LVIAISLRVDRVGLALQRLWRGQGLGIRLDERRRGKFIVGAAEAGALNFAARATF